MQGIHGYAVFYALVYGFEIKMNGVPLPVFQVVRQSVEAEFESAFHKFVQPEGGNLFRCQGFLFAEPLTFLIEVVDSCPQPLSGM